MDKKYYCIGIFLGDSIGSLYENKLCLNKEEIYPLFKEDLNSLSDDSILSLATIDYLLHSIIKDDYYLYLKKRYNLYPNSRYGLMFEKRSKSNKVDGYFSKGNGALMRISPIVYYFNDLETIKSETIKNVSTTHNSDEAILSSLIYVEVMFLLKNKHTKQDIKDYLKEKYQINPSKIKLNKDSLFAFDTLLNCLYFFFNSNDIKEIIENIITFNGDTDTILGITLTMGEFYYKIDKELIDILFNKLLKKDLIIFKLINEFNEYLIKKESRD